MVINNFETDENRILKILYDTHYNIYNEEEIPTSLRLLSRAAGLDEKRTRDICENLSNENLIDKVKVGDLFYYKINSFGIKVIESTGA